MIPPNTSRSTQMLRVQRGEVLGEALAQPLLVIVAPPDTVAPPLVSHLVRQEELRVVLERGRIVTPSEPAARQWHLQRGKVRRAVSARQFALDNTQRERRIEGAS